MTDASRQLALAVGPFRNRRLFSEHFMAALLPEWPEFAQLETSALHRELVALWRGEQAGLATANEAQTEQRLIQPVLRALGFAFTVQAGVPVAGGRRQPDYALFADDAVRARADRLDGAARYGEALAVADAKRFDRPLDVRAAPGAASEDPVAQIINYVSITRRRWGILTNGRLWRLYGAAGDLVEGACFEVDLGALLEADDSAALRYFAAFFAVGALTPGPVGRCFLDRALEESRANAVAVGDALQRQVFAAVPLIAEGLLADEARTEAALAGAFDSSLVVLYRLLFCLHAEARRLLPVDNPHYAHYSVARQREQLAADLAAGRVFSARSDDLYSDLRAVFGIVDRGDPALDVAEYDGGLFAPARHPHLAGRSVPDALLAPALDMLYRVAGEQVDYRGLSVRHLGTIYERLLDYRLVDDGGRLTLAPASGRRESGSYFTPAQVVDRIVERTLEPALQARSRAAAAVGLRGDDALGHFLELRVLDPAMGSGHFLVSAAAYVAQYVATDPSYDGELSLVEIQRLVAERCLYGVDLNPMAVELAQLSLWLTTVRRGEPLAFLPNLRVGNSLVGVDLGDLLEAGAGTLFAERLRGDADALLGSIAEIARRDSRTGDDVHAKERLAEAAQRLREPLEAYADETLRRELSSPPGRFFHWQLEFPEAFLDVDGRPRDAAGFDAIVGNPPYVRIQALGRELADWCRRRFATATGSFDVYVPFIERGLELLTPRGRLGFIVPNKLLKLDYGRRLRAHLAGEALVEEIVDFGDAQLFAGATNYTCILILDRSGSPQLAYRRVRGGPEAVRRALVDVDAVPSARFRTGGLGADPWVLATGEEARLLRHVADGAERLGDVTAGIFTGLQTSADGVYILEDRGRRGANQVVYSRASQLELELERDLLHPLASGGDVLPYAFAPLQTLLLFPYRRVGGEMRLLDPAELDALALTAAYLREHEQTLRGRERGKMDREGWYGYVYPKSLGSHDSAKLGVPRLCARLTASADPDGAVYLDNVDVNGILLAASGPSLWLLAALLNSRLLDFVFRRASVPFRGSFFSANKQFISPLPIRLPDDPVAFDALGEALHRAAAAIERERRGFLGWLADVLGVRLAGLPGHTRLAAYERASLAELLEVLRRSASRLGVDPSTRAFHARLEAERRESIGRLAALRAELARRRGEADAAVCDLYRLSEAQRRLVRDDAPAQP